MFKDWPFNIRMKNKGQDACLPELSIVANLIMKFKRYFNSK